MNDELYHYGTPRHSGRYPYGSGKEYAQHTSTFLTNYRKLHAQGVSDTDIAKGMKMTTTELRARRSLDSDEERASVINHVMDLKEKGYSNTKIGEMIGANESSVRSWIAQSKTDRVNATRNTADILMKNVDKKGYIDVGVGVERELGVSKTKLDTAVAMLKEKGYSVVTVKVPQATNPGQFTTVKVLAPPNTTWKDVNFNKDKIKSIEEYSQDNGKTYREILPPKSISSDRIKIRYGDDGGKEKDGVIELRRGVDDISLGNSNYAQVRIAVDGTHYLKGMAMYSDNIPKGADIVFNTNKKTGTDPKDVFKKMKDDPDNPFGASIKANGQSTYIDKNGKEQLSVINKLKEEGDWDHYSKSLSSQFLSKQPQYLIDRQLKLAYSEKKDEYDEICKLTNPEVKKKLLSTFSDKCDAAAVDLKAASLPRQSSKVLLPITTMKDTEVYAPTYKDGERVCLIRYPHGGTFEIPELVVNNKQRNAKEIMGNATDAIGINTKVAAKLSGADFDGDSVVVIPVNSKVKIKTSKSLTALKDFDPSDAYPGYKGMPAMSDKRKGLEMGKVSNLITDMTLRGAINDELVRAVKHSMVVIDAQKHNLNYKQSEIDNDIASLKTKYQGGPTKGASTLISKSSSQVRIPETKQYEMYKDVNKKTGEKTLRETGRTYIDKNGKEVKAQTKVTRMSLTKDARTLSSGTPQEESYANYANSMKALANSARKEYFSTKSIPMSSSAKTTYASEVSSLNSKLNVALKNAPRERTAQLIANSQIESKRKANPDMTKDEMKKIGNQALANARVRVGAGKKDVRVEISDKEWDAIQAGAISNNKLSLILNNTDLDKVRQRATPKATSTISSAKATRIKAMNDSGCTIAEIAEQLGISASSVSKSLHSDESV